MTCKEVANKIIEILKQVDEKDYYGMVRMFGSEKVCKQYIENSATQHPDMIITLLDGTCKKVKDEAIIAEINQLIKCIIR